MCLVLPGVEVEAQDVLDNTLSYVSLKKLVSSTNLINIMYIIYS